MICRTYKLPTECHRDAESVTIRQIIGEDENNAGIAAEARGKVGSLGEECIRLSIVEINGKQVSPPGTAPLASWLTQTRSYVGRYYSDLNGTDEEKIAPLVKEAQSTTREWTPKASR